MASLSAVAALALLPGCSGRGDKVRLADAPYAGPEVSLDVTSGQHLIVLNAPTGGWQFKLDRVRDSLEGKEAFVTASRPNPAYMHTQAFTLHRIGTQVPASVPLRVYARTLNHDEAPRSQPYHPAGRAPASGGR